MGEHQSGCSGLKFAERLGRTGAACPQVVEADQLKAGDIHQLVSQHPDAKAVCKVGDTIRLANVLP